MPCVRYEALLTSEILRPLLMTNATFDTAAAIAADHIAVGTDTAGGALNLSATCIPTPNAPGGWNAPCGCLWASADDIAKLIKFYFRTRPSPHLAACHAILTCYLLRCHPHMPLFATSQAPTDQRTSTPSP